MIPVPLFAIAAAAVVWLLSTGAAYVYGRSDGAALEEAAQGREERIAAIAAESAERAAARAIADIEVRHVTIRGKVETQIRDRVVYADCQHDQRMFDTINQAIVGADHRELPAARPAE